MDIFCRTIGRQCSFAKLKNGKVHGRPLLVLQLFFTKFTIINRRCAWEISSTKNNLRAKTAPLLPVVDSSEVRGFRRPRHMGRRWADSGIVQDFPGYKDVFALIDCWLCTCWVLDTLYRSVLSIIFPHAMHRPRCSWCHGIAQHQQPPAFVRGDPQWLGWSKL